MTRKKLINWNQLQLLALIGNFLDDLLVEKKSQEKWRIIFIIYVKERNDESTTAIYLYYPIVINVIAEMELEFGDKLRYISVKNLYPLLFFLWSASLKKIVRFFCIVITYITTTALPKWNPSCKLLFFPPVKLFILT